MSDMEQTHHFGDTEEARNYRIYKEHEPLIEEKRQKWQLELFPGFYVQTYQKPNWFHRKMQQLILGFKWTKYES